MHVETRAAFVRALEIFEPDVILCDDGAAEFNAAGALMAGYSTPEGLPSADER